MGRKRTPGLYKRDGIWHIDKKIFGRRVCESTGTGNLEEAEKYTAHRIDSIRQAMVYGTRPSYTFQEAAIKFLSENSHKASISDDARHLKQLAKHIGGLNLDQIHNGTLKTFIEARQKKGRKNKTINLALGVLQRILNLAASSDWVDENNLTWLHVAPKLKQLPTDDSRDAYPLSWEEQDKLFNLLPEHLREMALYKVNAGSRENEVCSLQWSWEIPIPELNTSVFLIPKTYVKNGMDRLVVLNDIAKAVIDRQRGKHPNYVFTYRGKPLSRMNNSSWKRKRKKAGLPVRVHDLKHTFGCRLRAAGVSFEDRQDLLGHKSSRITTHYSSAEIENLIIASNKVCRQNGIGQPVSLTVLKLKREWQSVAPDASSRKNPANVIELFNRHAA